MVYTMIKIFIVYGNINKKNIFKFKKINKNYSILSNTNFKYFFIKNDFYSLSIIDLYHYYAKNNIILYKNALILSKLLKK